MMSLEFKALTNGTIDIGTISTLNPKKPIYPVAYDWTANASCGFGVTGNPTVNTLRLYNAVTNHSYSVYFVYAI